jgi:hypothetical protein
MLNLMFDLLHRPHYTSPTTCVFALKARPGRNFQFSDRWLLIVIACAECRAIGASAILIICPGRVRLKLKRPLARAPLEQTQTAVPNLHFN